MPFRAGWSGGRGGISNSVPAVFGGTVLIGNSPAVVPGTWSGSPTLTYTYFRNGVPEVTLTGVALAVINAYVYVKADIGPALVVLEIPNGDVPNGVLSNTNAYDYLTRAAVYEVWELFNLANGALALLPGVKTGWDAAQAVGGQQPIVGAATFNGTRGLTFDGVDDLLLAAARDFSARSNVIFVAGMIDTAVANTGQLPVEFSGPGGVGANDGAWALVTNNAGFDILDPAGRNGGLGISRGATDMVAPSIYTAGIDLNAPGGGACSLLLRDGVDILTGIVLPNCLPGNLGNFPLSFGARSDGTLPWPGTYGGAIMLLLGNTITPDVTSANAYAAYRAGL